MTSNSKQIWYVIGAVAIILLAGWALMNRNGSAGPVTDNTDTQATSTDTTDGTTPATGGGTGTTGAGKLPAGWSSDAPTIPASAVISYSGSINPKTKALGPTIVYTTAGTPATSIAYFKAQFTAKGWTFRGQGDDLGSVMLAATKDTRRISISVLETRPGTVSVTIQILK